MRKFTVKKDGKYYSHQGAMEVWVPGIAGCYTYALDQAYALADRVGGEVVEVIKGDGGMFSFKEGPAPARESLARRVVTALLSEGDERLEMKPWFEMVQPATHWKDPIDKLVKPALTEPEKRMVSRAVSFFTATVPAFTDEADGTRVTAAGYHAGPAGDH